MRDSIKACVLRVLAGCGFEMRRLSSVPFGSEWYRDVKYFGARDGLQTILDIGANTGQTALTAREQFPESMIYSFEPVPSTFLELERNTAKHPQIRPFRMALGAAKGSARITTEPLSVSNTLLAQADSDSREESRVEVQVGTVDSFCAEQGIERIDLLKVDTEGYEIEVLKGASEMLSERRVDFVLAECDFFRRQTEPHGDFGEIFKCLSEFGFHVVSFYSGGVDDLGWVWGDVLFKQVSGSQAGRVSCSPETSRFRPK